MVITFSTTEIAAVRRKLAAARELFHGPGFEHELRICAPRSSSVLLSTDKRDNTIFPCGLGLLVERLGRKLVQVEVDEAVCRLNPALQEGVPRWHLVIRKLDVMDPDRIAAARAGDALEEISKRLTKEEIGG
jgi:hypothetical protein